MVSVRELMHELTKVSGEKTVAEVAKLMKNKEIGSVVVEEKGKIKGIITERDILKRVVAEGKDPKRTKASEIMTPNPKTIDGNADLLAASEKISQMNVRRLLITDKTGKIVGIVTARNIVKSIPYHVARIKLGDYVRKG